MAGSGGGGRVGLERPHGAMLIAKGSLKRKRLLHK